MSIFLWSTLAGWASWFALLRGAIYPFEQKNVRDTRPYIVRLQPHYWIGFLTLAAALLHAVIALQMPRFGGANMTGIWVAIVALVVLLAQAALGSVLQYAFAGRRYFRRLHFWSGIALVPLLAVHLALN